MSKEASYVTELERLNALAYQVGAEKALKLFKTGDDTILSAVLNENINVRGKISKRYPTSEKQILEMVSGIEKDQMPTVLKSLHDKLGLKEQDYQLVSDAAAYERLLAVWIKEDPQL